MYPFAQWSPARDVWTPMAGPAILPMFEHLAVYSETFPTSGSMRNGMVYSRPTSVPLMGGSVSSFLPTPAAYDSDRGGTQSPEKRRAGGHQPSLADVLTHL